MRDIEEVVGERSGRARRAQRRQPAGDEAPVGRLRNVQGHVHRFRRGQPHDPELFADAERRGSACQTVGGAAQHPGATEQPNLQPAAPPQLAGQGDRVPGVLERGVEVAEHRPGGGGWRGDRLAHGSRPAVGAGPVPPSVRAPATPSRGAPRPPRASPGRRGAVACRRLRARGCPRSGPRRRTASRDSRTAGARRRPSPRPAARGGAGSGRGRRPPPRRAAAGRRRRRDPPAPTGSGVVPTSAARATGYQPDEVRVGTPMTHCTARGLTPRYGAGNVCDGAVTIGIWRVPVAATGPAGNPYSDEVTGRPTGGCPVSDPNERGC